MTNNGLNKTFVLLAGVQKKASTPTSTPVAMVPEEDDPYGGSTDEASDMETETGIMCMYMQMYIGYTYIL